MITFVWLTLVIPVNINQPKNDQMAVAFTLLAQTPRHVPSILLVFASSDAYRWNLDDPTNMLEVSVGRYHLREPSYDQKSAKRSTILTDN